MDYAATLTYLLDCLPVYHRIGRAAFKPGLENAIRLDEYFHYSHRKYKTIHVAGTNGKGSVCHMLASVLQQAGYKVGLHTSPHLTDFRERIKVNGRFCSRNYVVDFVRQHKRIIESLHPSFFEISVFMAMDYFARQQVDVAVIEVGLGGRLDTTNVITPVLSVITSIGIDHTDLLGNTLEKIAGEKAGIIKNGVPVVIGETLPETSPVFTRIAEEKNCRIVFADQQYHIDYNMMTPDGCQLFQVKRGNQIVLPNLKIELQGMYQKKNTITLIQSVDILKELGFEITPLDLYNGLRKTIEHTGIQGRWQTVAYHPQIIMDCAHNADGMQEVIRQVGHTAFENLHMIIGFVNDKDVKSIISLLPLNASYYFTRSTVPRSMHEDDLKQLAGTFGLKGDSFSSIHTAIQAVRKKARSNDLVIITGSMFLVADFLSQQTVK